MSSIGFLDDILELLTEWKPSETEKAGGLPEGNGHTALMDCTEA